VRANYYNNMKATSSHIQRNGIIINLFVQYAHTHTQTRIELLTCIQERHKSSRFKHDHVRGTFSDE